MVSIMPWFAPDSKPGESLRWNDRSKYFSAGAAARPSKPARSLSTVSKPSRSKAASWPGRSPDRTPPHGFPPRCRPPRSDGRRRAFRASALFAWIERPAQALDAGREVSNQRAGIGVSPGALHIGHRAEIGTDGVDHRAHILQPGARAWIANGGLRIAAALVLSSRIASKRRNGCAGLVDGDVGAGQAVPPEDFVEHERPAGVGDIGDQRSARRSAMRGISGWTNR